MNDKSDKNSEIPRPFHLNAPRAKLLKLFACSSRRWPRIQCINLLSSCTLAKSSSRWLCLSIQRFRVREVATEVYINICGDKFSISRTSNQLSKFPVELTRHQAWHSQFRYFKPWVVNFPFVKRQYVVFPVHIMKMKVHSKMNIRVV